MTRDEPAPFDTALVIAASEARVRQHVLTGLLHDLNGPLNNLGLTLTLLGRALEPWLLAHAGDDTSLRLRRYLATLVQESGRLALWSRAASAVVHPGMAGEGPLPVARLLDDAVRLLRHHATLAEVRLAADATHARGGEVADGCAASAALLSFVVAGIALAQPGGVVALGADTRVDGAIVRVEVAPARDGAALERAFAQPPAAPASPVEEHLLAGRVQAEAMGGHAAFTRSAGRVDIAITFPRG